MPVRDFHWVPIPIALIKCCIVATTLSRALEVKNMGSLRSGDRNMKPRRWWLSISTCAMSLEQQHFQIYLHAWHKMQTIYNFILTEHSLHADNYFLNSEVEAIQ